MLRGALVLSCRKLTAGRFGSLAGYAFSKLEMMALGCASAARDVRSDTKGAWTFPLTMPELKIWPKSRSSDAFEENSGPPARRLYLLIREASKEPTVKKLRGLRAICRCV